MLTQEDFEPIGEMDWQANLQEAKLKNLAYATGDIHDINKFVEWEDPQDCELYRNTNDNCLLLIGK